MVVVLTPGSLAPESLLVLNSSPPLFYGFCHSLIPIPQGPLHGFFRLVLTRLYLKPGDSETFSSDLDKDVGDLLNPLWVTCSWQTRNMCWRQEPTLVFGTVNRAETSRSGFVAWTPVFTNYAALGHF